MERVLLVKPPRILWPKSKKVSWETLFDVIYSLDQVGVIHPQLKTNTVDPWDPCWFNGEVKTSRKKIGVTIRHVNTLLKYMATDDKQENYDHHQPSVLTGVA